MYVSTLYILMWGPLYWTYFASFSRLCSIHDTYTAINQQNLQNHITVLTRNPHNSQHLAPFGNRLGNFTQNAFYKTIQALTKLLNVFAHFLFLSSNLWKGWITFIQWHCMKNFSQLWIKMSHRFVCLFFWLDFNINIWSAQWGCSFSQFFGISTEEHYRYTPCTELLYNQVYMIYANSQVFTFHCLVLTPDTVIFYYDLCHYNNTNAYLSVKTHRR